MAVWDAKLSRTKEEPPRKKRSSPKKEDMAKGGPVQKHGEESERRGAHSRLK